MNKLRFAAIGFNHGHIYEQVRLLQASGAELAAYYAPEPELAADFGQAHPDVKLASSAAEILEDESIALVTSAGVPCERADLGIQVMRHNKDFLSDKPAFTDLAKLEETRRVQAETKKFFTVFYGRLASPALQRACDIAGSGALGKIINTIGTGPHRINLSARPPWFFERGKYGGILVDIGSHQFDMFLAVCGTEQVDVAAAQVANYKYPQFNGLEDFGDTLLRAGQVSGYIRVDWYTPDSLPSFGDGRFFVLGTEGYVETRGEVDPGGRPGGGHLIVSDHKETRHIDCSTDEHPFMPRYLDDIRNRTETAVSQQHIFLASELALRAQNAATRLGNLEA